MVNLTHADISENAGVQAIFERNSKHRPWIMPPIADGTCDRLKLIDNASTPVRVIGFVQRCKNQEGITPIGRQMYLRSNDATAATGTRSSKRIDVSHAMPIVTRGRNMLR